MGLDDYQERRPDKFFLYFITWLAIVLLLIAFVACSKSNPPTARELEIARELTLKPHDSLMWEIQGLRFSYPDSLSIEGQTPHEYNSWQTFNWQEMTEYTLYAHFKNGGTVLKVTGHTDAPGHPKTSVLTVTPGVGRVAIYKIRKGVNVFRFRKI